MICDHMSSDHMIYDVRLMAYDTVQVLPILQTIYDTVHLWLPSVMVAMSPAPL